MRTETRREEQTFGELTGHIADLIKALGFAPTDSVATRYANLAQLGAMVLAFAHDERQYQAKGMVTEYLPAMHDLQREVEAERQRRSSAGAAILEDLVSGARALITWVCAAAAVSGLLIGPIGLLLLRRVLSRLQGVGTALVRLARNDTSVDIPGLSHQDEVGQLARSVAVFKSKSIELQQKKWRGRAAQPAARRGHQQHAARAQHVRCPGAPAGVQQALRRDVRAAE